ncbi:MAG: hypothetical protein R2942_07845 [Ignavibacteria bacterium]
MKIERINEIIQNAAGEDAKYIFGLVDDAKMAEEIMVTVIATGFNKQSAAVSDSDYSEQEIAANAVRQHSNLSKKGKITVLPNHEELSTYDKPGYVRREVKLNDDLSEELNKKKVVDDFDEPDGFENLENSEYDDYSKPAFLRRQMD